MALDLFIFTIFTHSTTNRHSLPFMWLWVDISHEYPHFLCCSSFALSYYDTSSLLSYHHCLGCFLINPSQYITITVFILYFILLLSTLTLLCHLYCYFIKLLILFFNYHSIIVFLGFLLFIFSFFHSSCLSHTSICTFGYIFFLRYGDYIRLSMENCKCWHWQNILS